MELTSLTPADGNTLFRWINDRNTVILSGPFAPVSREDHDRWLARITNAPDVRIFAIRVGGQLIGTCQLFDISMQHRSAELQIRIGEKPARGNGYGTAAVLKLLDYAVCLGLHRVWLRAFATNHAAIRCYEKCGFLKEGLQKDVALIEGKWVDIILMGALLD